MGYLKFKLMNIELVFLLMRVQRKNSAPHPSPGVNRVNMGHLTEALGLLFRAFKFVPWPTHEPEKEVLPQIKEMRNICLS